MRDNRIIAFDLDGTLCHLPKEFEELGYEKYLHSIPNYDMINIANKLYDDGNTIIIYTSRGMATFNGDLHQVHEKLFALTNDSLKKWGVKYHMLSMGKIDYDFIIDDKAINSNEIDKIKNL